MATELIQALARSGMRVFDRHDLTNVASSVGLLQSYVPRMLSLMTHQGSFIIPW